MALFGNLFEKKQCSICGGDIGLMGNRKLEDGNCCKECAAKLSPWFSDRRQSTVEEIKAQLDYRAANQQKVASFHATRTLGEGTKVILDEDAGLFMVTSARNWQSANPDVLAFSDVTGCNLDIDENRTEIQYKDAEGKRQSFNPKRYAYSYDFYIVIHVNNPYFGEIRFKLNDASVDNDEETLLEGPTALPRARSGAARPVQNTARPGAPRPVQGAARPGAPQKAAGAARPGVSPTRPGATRPAAAQPAPGPVRPGAARPVSAPPRPVSAPPRPGSSRPMPDRIPMSGGMVGGGLMGGVRTSNADEVRASFEYQQYEQLGEEIRDALLQVRQDARDSAAAAAAPKMAVTCPCCGATTVPDASGCCEFCGGAVGG